MTVRSKIAIVVLLGVSATLAWFLAIRSYDIRYRFEVKTLPEIAYVTLKAWVSTSGKVVSMNPSELVAVQILEKDKETFTIEWEVTNAQDSVAVITASLTSDRNRLSSRIGSLFIDTSIKMEGDALVRDFYGVLKDHLRKVKVEVVGESEFSPSSCLCLAVETNQVGKASGMMSYYNALSDFVVKNELKLSGNPVVNVTDWDEQQDFLRYDFCYPVAPKTIDLTGSPFYYKELPGQQVIKAKYYGNYITSDRAWYALMHYAKSNDLRIIEKPIEIFFNNPNVDADEQSWLAEVYLPVLQE